MSSLKSMYKSYYSPTNADVGRNINSFDFNNRAYTELSTEMYQDHKRYAGKDFQVGMKRVFEHDDFIDEPVGELFFSENNINRLQKKIKDEIYERTKHKIVLDEDQDSGDLIIAMRAVYQMKGKFIKQNIVHQVKELNKILVNYVVPDMITEIKQYYGYLKDINEPIKPIDRPMNVSNAGRKTLPSMSSIWNM